MLCLAVARSLPAQTADEIVASLQQRGKAQKSVLIAWKGHCFRSKDLGPEARTSDAEFGTAGKLIYEASGRKRMEMVGAEWSDDLEEMVPIEVTAADDGSGEKTLSSGGNIGHTTFFMGSKLPSKIKQLRFTPMRLAYWPLDAAIGVCKAAAVKPIVEKGDIDSRPHLVVSFGNDRIWVDPSRDLLPVRLQRFTNGKLSVVADLEYKQVEDQWRPSTWKVSHLHDGKPLLSFTESVTSLTLDFPTQASDFQLEPPPESYVSDTAKKEQYMILKDGSKRLIKPGEFTGKNFEELLRGVGNN